jgi:SAM-dependent methyltransferase
MNGIPSIRAATSSKRIRGCWHFALPTLPAAITSDTSAPSAGRGSEPFEERNVLDRLTPRSTLEDYYRHELARERAIVARRLGIGGGEVLSVGCGWHPGRHLFPAPAFTLLGVDADPARVAGVIEAGRADRARVGHAGELDLPNASFEVVLYRLVLHHLAYQGPLEPVFAEAARLLRPGGALVAIEPGLWHPVGLGLALANRVGAATAIHGTPDDIPLAPTTLTTQASRAGLRPELHAVTYSWRRLPPALQRAVRPLDVLGSRRRAAPFGHTLLLIARK